MGGKVLEYEAKTILNQGISLGFIRGRSEGRDEGLREGRDEGINEERASGICILIQTYKKFGKERADAVQAIVDEYHLSVEEAEEIVKKNW
jgi:predicted transposase YdaD